MSKQAKDAPVDPVQSAAAAAGHLYEAKERIKDAASAVVGAVKSAATTAASAAREDIDAGSDAIRDPLTDAAAAASAAVSEARAAAGAEVEVLVEKGKALLSSAGDAIRKHPVASFGAAFAVGWLIAKLGRRD